MTRDAGNSPPAQGPALYYIEVPIKPAHVAKWYRLRERAEGEGYGESNFDLMWYEMKTMLRKPLEWLERESKHMGIPSTSDFKSGRECRAYFKRTGRPQTWTYVIYPRCDRARFEIADKELATKFLMLFGTDPVLGDGPIFP